MNQKSVGIAYLLWFFLGILGIHKFYLEKVGMGILYFFTGGIFGIGWLIDLFTLSSQVRSFNDRELYNRTGRTVVVEQAMHPGSGATATPEKQILDLAEPGLPFTLREVIKETALDIETAENALEKLLSRGLIRKQMSEYGEVEYVEH